MVSERDIQEDINWIKEFRNNATRAMGLRMQIVRNRLKAVNLLKQDLQSKEGLALLKRTIKNERWFNRIIEKGLAESFDKLKEIYALMNEHVKDKEAKNNTKRLIELVEYLYSKSRDIDKRLKLEEAFLERQDQKSFNRFLKEWEKDFKIRKKIINKIAGVEVLTGYFKNKFVFFADKIIMRGNQGIVMGAATGGLWAILDHFFTKEGAKVSEFASIVGTYAFAWILGGIIMDLIKLECGTEKHYPSQ